MRSDRITQLLAKYIGMAAMAVAVWLVPDISDEQKAGVLEWVGSITAGLVGLFGVFIDLAIHALNNGGVLHAPKSGGTVSPADATRTGLLLLLVLPAVLIGVGGCAGGVGSSYRRANTLYTGAVEIATTMARTGAMDLETANDFEATRAEARALLDAWGEIEAARLRGADVGEFNGWQRLEALLDAMIEAQIQENTSHGTNHTGGVGDAAGDDEGRRRDRRADPGGRPAAAGYLAAGA